MARATEQNPEIEHTAHPEALLALLINEGLKRKGITLQKLADVSGIAIKHLEHMAGGNLEKLPPAPYLRSYMAVVGEVLDFDGQALWDRIRVDELAVDETQNDRFPQRLSNFSSKKKIIWIGVLAFIIGIYLLFRLPEIVGQPSLDIGFPSEAVSTVSVTPVTIIGSVKNGDEFFVNGERVPLEQDGVWQKNIDLQEGMNTIELKAKKFLGREIRVLRQVIYSPGADPIIRNTSSTEDTTSSTEKASTTRNEGSTSTKKETSSRL